MFSTSDSVKRKGTGSEKQNFFPAKQRGYYSDILREEAESELEVNNGFSHFIFYIYTVIRCRNS